MRFNTLSVFAISCALTGTLLAQQATTQQPNEPLRPSHQGRNMRQGGSTELPASAANVKKDDQVITLKGACEGPSKQDGCVNGVTREQFENLTNALRPDMPTEMKISFANNYGKLLVFADTARSLGLDKDPKVQERLSFVQNQLLLDALNQHYQEEFSHSTDKEIEDYYNQNKNKYREATLQQVVIPREPASSDVKKATDEEFKAYVDETRKKWAAGGDPVALQKDAMAKAGMTTPPPDVNVGARQPGQLPMGHEAVFDLKAGEISQPFSDAGATYIYKVVSERQVPVNEVKASISKALQMQKMKDKIQQITDSSKTVLNEAYFGNTNPTQPPPAEGAQQAPPQAGSAPAADAKAAAPAQSSTPPQR